MLVGLSYLHVFVYLRDFSSFVSCQHAAHQADTCCIDQADDGLRYSQVCPSCFIDLLAQVPMSPVRLTRLAGCAACVLHSSRPTGRAPAASSVNAPTAKVTLGPTRSDISLGCHTSPRATSRPWTCCRG